MTSSNGKKMKQLVAVVTRGEGEEQKRWWTNIGVAFENHDGSWTLKFDYFPTNPATGIQLRDFNERDERAEPGADG